MKNQAVFNASKTPGAAAGGHTPGAIREDAKGAKAGFGRICLALGLLVGSLLAASPGWANPQVVVIDNFTIEHDVLVTAQAPATPNPTDEQVVEDTTSGNDNIIGGWRKVFLEKTAGANNRAAGSSVDGSERNVSHDNFSGVTSVLEMTWDGTDDLGNLNFNLRLFPEIVLPILDRSN